MPAILLQTAPLKVPVKPSYVKFAKGTILLQTAPLKVPVKPSYVKFAKGTPSAHFLKFCKVGTRANYCKNKAKKNTPSPMPSWPNYHFLKVPT